VICMMRRRILAVAAIVSLLAGAVLWLCGAETHPEWLAFFTRTGGVLLAAWLAFDDVQRLPGWLLFLLPALLIVAVRWPRYLLLLMPVLILCAILRRGTSRR
jgi:hypothetical protein